MGRSIRFPTGAQVCFTVLETEDDDDAEEDAALAAYSIRLVVESSAKPLSDSKAPWVAVATRVRRPLASCAQPRAPPHHKD